MKRSALKAALLVCTVATGSLGTPVLAEEKAPGSGPNPFVDCGIGAALFPNTHWAAVTSNVIWDIGVTAVISATASPETCQGKSAEVARFINESFETLEQETAEGQGEHLVAMLDILSCSNAVRSEIIDQVRQDYGVAANTQGFNQKVREQKVYDYYNTVTRAVGEQEDGSCSA